MVKKECIFPANAPIPAGPYSPALKVGNLLFISGQTPEKPGTDELVEGDIKIQTRQVMENIKNIIAAADCSMNQVVKITTHLKDIRDFDGYNDVYRTYFSEPYPARTTVQSVIPGGSLVEIEAVVIVEEN
jgi:2-iminobutanoate/2-iminopropanoate deaminase